MAETQTGEREMTAEEQEHLKQVRAIKTFTATVANVTQLTPGMVRITISGGGLPGYQRLGPDDFVYTFFPKPGDEKTTADASFSWEAYRGMTPEEQPVGRYYTVRNYRPEVHEIDLDVVIHEAGPGAEWASTAKVGQGVAIWGPRKAYEPDPAADWQLLYADDTGLPATLAICENAVPGTVIRAFIEVAGPEHEHPVAAKDGVEITWVHRAADEHAGECDALLRAIRAAELPTGSVYAWGAAEHGVLEGIRAHLVGERGVPAASIRAVAYWQHGKSRS